MKLKYDQAKAIGSRLLVFRLKKNLTQKQFADFIGTSDAPISYYECGKGRNKEILTNHLKRVVSAFQLSTNDLRYFLTGLQPNERILPKKQIFETKPRKSAIIKRGGYCEPQIRVAIGKQLSILRKKYNMSHTEFATKIGVTGTNSANYEYGVIQSKMSIENYVHRVGRAFNLNQKEIDNIFSGLNNPQDQGEQEQIPEEPAVKQEPIPSLNEIREKIKESKLKKEEKTPTLNDIKEQIKTWSPEYLNQVREQLEKENSAQEKVFAAHFNTAAASKQLQANKQKKLKPQKSSIQKSRTEKKKHTALKTVRFFIYINMLLIALSAVACVWLDFRLCIKFLISFIVLLLFQWLTNKLFLGKMLI